MWGVRLGAIILVLHVTKATESDIQQFLSSNDDEEILKTIPMWNDEPDNLDQPTTLAEVEYDQYYDTTNNDTRDKTRKKRQSLPNDCNVFKCRGYINEMIDAYSTEREHKDKFRMSQIWKDRLKKLIHRNFVPNKKCDHHTSGKSNYYKTFRVSSVAENFNTNIKKAYFSPIGGKKKILSFEPISRQQNSETDNIPNNVTASNVNLDQNDVSNTGVLGIGQAPDDQEQNHPSQINDSESLIHSNGVAPTLFASIALTNDQSKVPLTFSIGNNMPKITDNVKSNTDFSHSSTDTDESSLLLSSHTYNSASNGNNLNQLPLDEDNDSLFPRDESNKITKSVPNYMLPLIYKFPYVFMPPSAYENYVPNAFNLPSYPIGHPMIYNDQPLQSYNSIYQKYYPNVNDQYNQNHDETFTAPYKYDRFVPYRHIKKNSEYQRPNIDQSFDKDRHILVPKENPIIPAMFLPPGEPRPPFKSKMKEFVRNISSNPAVRDDEYRLTKNYYAYKYPKIDDHVKNTDEGNLHWPYENYELNFNNYYTPDYETVKPMFKNAECGNDTAWVRNCHTCSCNDGEAVCERIEKCKLRAFGEPMLCKPYSKFKLDDCYVCECNGDGIPECTIEDCGQDMGFWNCYLNGTGTGGTKGTPQEETDDQFLEGPSGQRLVEYNNNYQKLSNYCPPQNKIPTCEQWTIWTSNCHECRCNEYGTRECVRLVDCQLEATGYGKPTQCKPNSTFLPKLPLLYQQCHCDDEGKPHCLAPRYIKH